MSSLRQAGASKSRSRTRASRNTSTSSARFMVGTMIPDAPVDLEAVDLLNDLVHRRHGEEPTLVEEPADGEDDAKELEEMKKLPWWKRPSPWWLISIMPIMAIATSATIAPQIEILTQLACKAHEAEYFVGRGEDLIAWIDSPSDLLYSPLPIGHNIVMDDFTNLREIERSVILTSDPDEDVKYPNRCNTDPVVLAATAMLMTAITGTTGVLNCFTTGWWASLSDRRGRTFVIGVSALGLLLNDSIFILVAFFSDRLPGGYWFLLIGSLVEGLLGGVSVTVAYLADCTDRSSLSRILSISTGLMFIGAALGPTLGGILIRLTHHTLFPFYFSTSVHVLFTLFVWSILPESLSRAKMAAARARRKSEEQQDAAEGGTPWSRRMWGFLSPLAVLIPVRIDSNDVSPANSIGKRKRDWSLTLVAICLGCSTMVAASIPYKLQYALSSVGLNSEQMGYMLTLVFSARSFYLVLILPAVIKLYKHFTSPATELPTEPSEPLSASTSSEPNTPNHIPAKPIYSPVFDLGLAKISLLVEIACYLSIPFAPTPVLFTVLSMLESLGAGFGPALHSFALDLYTRREDGTETGKLFGAINVVQAITAQVLGPAIFGLTFAKTADFLPSSIFFLSAAGLAISFIFLSVVRVPKGSIHVEDAESSIPDRREQTLVGTEQEPLLPDSMRGRKVQTTDV